MKVINFFAGPGSGKSTTTALLFARLKQAGINAEMSLEYAKDKVWEESFKVLEDQIYIFGKQLHKLIRLKGQVDVVITDAPLLNSIVYDKSNDSLFRALVLQEFNKFDNMNFFISRAKAYNPKGRMQTVEGAKELDTITHQMLIDNKIDFRETVGDGPTTNTLIDNIVAQLVKK